MKSKSCVNVQTFITFDQVKIDDITVYLLIYIPI